MTKTRDKKIKLKMKEKVQIPLKVMWRFFIEFCDNSNIHGVGYFTKRFLHWSERLWWVIALILSLWLCGSMIHDVWLEWNEHPIDHEFVEKTHISEIPFPTVTVCPEIKTLKHKLNISSKFTLKNNQYVLDANLSEIEAAQIDVMSHICKFSNIKPKDNFTNESIYTIIKDLAPNLEYTIQECRWQQQKINCSQHISSVFTEHGLCFTFNALNFHDMYTDVVASSTMVTKNDQNASHWNLEEGYRKDFTDSEYPVRAFQSGRKDALELTLTGYKKDYDYLCSRHFQGFVLYLGLSSETFMEINALQTEYSEDTTIMIKPKVMRTSKGLRNYEPKQRDCFFNSEHKLRFFKTYTKINCIVECTTNFTMEMCGCTAFYMPRDENTKICSSAEFQCYKQAEIIYQSTESIRFRQKCNCLSACTSIEYEAKMERIRSSIDTVGKAYESQTNDQSQQKTKVTIFLEEDFIEMETRVETMTFGDFLSTCGGLLGLFLGVSLLSIVELIYYSTLRLFWPQLELNEQSDEGESDTIRIDRNAWNHQNRTVEKLFRFIRGMRSFFIEVCANSNIHGLCYFSKRMLHWSERLLWLVAFGVSLWLCGSMIHNVWINWTEDPATFDYKRRIVLDSIPFPTVTICPEIKTVKPNLDVNDALSYLSNLSDIETARLNALAHVCPLLPNFIPYKDNFTNESIYDTIQDIAPNIFQSIDSCNWQRRPKPCSELLTPVLTEDGLCFTFNSLNSHEIYTNEMAPGMMIVKNNRNISRWSSDNGYVNNYADGNYPFQSDVWKGSQNYLVLFLKINRKDVDYQCSGCDEGFKMILSMPGETVETSQNYLRLPMSETAIAEIASKLTITSEGLRTYTSNQRQCFFNTEKPLRFFKIFTERNCNAECVANFTRIECGCVKFSMPRDEHTKICGGANVKCYKSAKRNLFTTEHGKIFREKCNCLPSCTSIEYNIAKIQRTKIVQTTLQALGAFGDKQVSIIGIGFGNKFIEAVKRKEMYKFGDFLAASGGLLGLFLGVSFLSVIELIYYSTLRLFWTIKMDRNIN